MPETLVDQILMFEEENIKLEDGAHAAIVEPDVLSGGNPEFFVRLHSWVDFDSPLKVEDRHRLLRRLAGKKLRLVISEVD